MYRKEIIVLSGGANRAVVKLTTSLNGKLKGNCRVEFKPKDAALYILGEKCYEIELKNYDTAFEISDDGGDYACVLLSDFPPMFGTGRAHIMRQDAILRAEMFRNNLKNGHSYVNKADNVTSQPSFRTAYGETVTEEPKTSEKQKKEAELKSANQNNETDTISKDNLAKGVLNRNRKSINSEDNNSRQTENIKSNINRVEFEKYDIERQSADYGQTLNNKNKQEDILEVMESTTQYEGDNFYYAVKPQLDEMFVRYPEDVELDSVVPNSRWIRVATKDDFYVVGILYDGSDPVYICYGIPGKFTEKPSASLSEVCVWLSLDGVEEKTAEDGYWVIYQSAKDGKIIK